MLLSQQMLQLGKRLYPFRRALPLLFLAGSFVALLLATPFYVFDGGPLYALLCLVISLKGVLFRSVAAGSEGALVAHLREGSSTQFRGPYSLVRHPQALGSMLIVTGVLLYTGVWAWVVAGVVIYAWGGEKVLLYQEARWSEQFGEPYKRWAEGRPLLMPRRITLGLLTPVQGADRIVMLRTMVRQWGVVAILFPLLAVMKWRMIHFFTWEPISIGWYIVLGAVVVGWVVLYAAYRGALRK